MNRFSSRKNANATANANQSAVAEWLCSSEGEMVLQREQQRINAQLARATVLMPSRVVYQSRPWFEKEQFSGERVMELHTAESFGGNNWPLPPEPVDLLLLPHEFELCNEPQSALRWADTVLSDGGWLIITGFKPEGLLGLLFGRRMGKGWSRNRVSGSMLRLWLTEAGYKVIEHENWSYAKALEAQRSGLMNWLPQWLRPKHHGYLVAARKITTPSTPLVSHWKGLGNPLGVSVSAAASRGLSAPARAQQISTPRNLTINDKVRHSG